MNALNTLISGVLSISSAAAGITTFEAESGTSGANYAETTDPLALGATYLKPLAAQTGGSPNSVESIATYQLDLPQGTYDLYARIQVGPDGGQDDSLFVGNGFGSKNINTDSDWVEVNNLDQSKNTYLSPEGSQIVNGVWTWIRLSNQVTVAESVPQFTSSGGAMTFQIAQREDGLLIDSLSFVSTGQTPGSPQLSNGGGPREVVKWGRKWKEWVLPWVDQSGNGRMRQGCKEAGLLIPSGVSGDLPVRGIHLLTQSLHPNFEVQMDVATKTLKRNADGSLNLRVTDGNMCKLMHDNGFAILSCGDSDGGDPLFWSWAPSDALRQALAAETGHPELVDAGAILNGLSRGGRAAAGYAASGSNRDKVLAVILDVSTTYTFGSSMFAPLAIPGVPMLYYASWADLYEGTDRRSTHYSSTTTCYSAAYGNGSLPVDPWHPSSALIDPLLLAHESPDNKYYQNKWLQGVINLRAPASNTANNFQLPATEGESSGFGVKCDLPSTNGRTYYDNIVIKKWTEFSASEKLNLNFWLPDAPTVHEFIERSSTSGPTGNPSEISITTSTSIPTKDQSTPSMPTDLKISNLGNGTHRLNWTPSTDNEAILFYRIYLDGTIITGVPASASSYTFTELTNRQSYNVRIQAVDSSGNASTLSDLLSYSVRNPSPGVNMNADDTVTIGFPAVPNKRYFIQYSNTLAGKWETVSPGIVATSNSAQWTDSGPPETESEPLSISRRFYRVVKTVESQ
ncbi:fibronectin type III domain-containing protein [Haloferula sp.]|uniref:fibronectin type III domain-containing protein n=1 Tax=Haloferula sp. TaxID=2497595 RepID=UPI003C789A20